MVPSTPPRSQVEEPGRYRLHTQEAKLVPFGHVAGQSDNDGIVKGMMHKAKLLQEGDHERSQCHKGRGPGQEG